MITIIRSGVTLPVSRRGYFFGKHIDKAFDVEENMQTCGKKYTSNVVKELKPGELSSVSAGLWFAALIVRIEGFLRGQAEARLKQINNISIKDGSFFWFFRIDRGAKSWRLIFY